MVSESMVNIYRDGMGSVGRGGGGVRVWQGLGGGLVYRYNRPVNIYHRSIGLYALRRAGI